MKQLKVFFLIFSFTIISCQENRSKERNLKPDVNNEIIGHTFLKVKKTKNSRVLYKPCDSNIPKYKIYKDSIFHNWGQEYYTYNIELIKNINSQTVYKTTYKYNSEIPDTKDSLIIFKKIEKSKGYWEINGDLFVDSLYMNTLSHVSQPCSECYNCEDIVSNSTKSNLKKWYGRYQVLLNKDKDWEEQISITIDIKKDSIIYESAGYQTYEKYLLTGKESNNKLSLVYLKLLDGLESAVLKKTKDFGNIYFDSKKYSWESPYLNFYYGDKIYILNKTQ